eukprot:763421-Hanusia_phi.AAC.1
MARAAMARAAMAALFMACLVDVSLAFSLQPQPVLLRQGLKRAFVARNPPAPRCYSRRTRIGHQKACPALVYMNAKDEFIPATVLSNEEAAAGMYKIMLEVDPAVCTSYKVWEDDWEDEQLKAFYQDPRAIPQDQERFQHGEAWILCRR